MMKIHSESVSEPRRILRSVSPSPSLSLKISTLVISFLVMSSILYAQDTMNQTDSKGRKQGPWRKLERGVLKYEGQFRDDKPVGTFTYYYDNKSIKAVSHFESGGQVSRTTLYHPEGGVMAVGKYLGTQKDSIWTYYSTAGKMVARESYHAGVKDGTWFTYYEGGQVSEEMPWKKDQRHGVSVQYYHDGTIKAKISYANDLLDGLSLFYHPNGTIMVSGMYRRSLKHGKWLSFDDKGLTIRTESYSKGYLVKVEEHRQDKNIRTLRKDEEENRYMPGRKPPGQVPADSLLQGEE